MKLQILHLKPHDDDVSAREKLSWVKADRVLLVWPRHGQPLQRRLDLVLLQRKASQQGLDLGLVTHDPIIRDHAARLHIPVFESLDSIPEERWQAAAEASEPLPNRTEPEPESETETEAPPMPPDTPSRRASQNRPDFIRIPAFVIGLAAFFSLVAALAPSATLIATPRTESRRSEGRVRLDPGLQSPDPEDGTIPARIVRAEVGGSMRIRSGGQSAQPSEPARGTVVFRNLTDEAHTIPAGTSVRTQEAPAQRFLTTEEAEVAAGQGESVEVPVEAAEPGRGGNVAAGSIQAVDGPLGLALEVENPQSLSGGSAALQPAVTADDRERLRAELSQDLLSQAAADLRADLESGYSLANSSLQVDRTLIERFDRGAGEVGASVGLTLELRVSGYAYRPADLRSLAEAQLVNREPSGWAPVPGSLAVQVNRTSGSQEEGVYIHYGATWTSYQVVPAQPIRSEAAGSYPETAEQNLAREFDLEDLSVRLRPGWLPRLPLLPARIELVYPWQAGP